MRIGIPRETRDSETRVSATPETIKKYVAAGHQEIRAQTGPESAQVQGFTGFGVGTVIEICDNQYYYVVRWAGKFGLNGYINSYPEKVLQSVVGEWHSGPPPHVGWWLASHSKDERVWRWWNGEVWSKDVHKDADADMAAAMSKRKAIETSIQWSDYYPENARVTRVNPKVA